MIAIARDYDWMQRNKLNCVAADGVVSEVRITKRRAINNHTWVVMIIVVYLEYRTVNAMHADMYRLTCQHDQPHFGSIKYYDHTMDLSLSVLRN